MKLPREFFVPLEALLFKAIYPDFFIFILTQGDRPEYRNAAFQLGAVRFIAKVSLNRIQLEELVKSHFNIYESENRVRRKPKEVLQK
jgi:DNA-binding NarL/FixJ family response regulator